MKGLKIKVPPFVGTSDRYADLDWENKIKQIFNCQNYFNVEKVNVVALKFKAHTLLW